MAAPRLPDDLCPGSLSLPRPCLYLSYFLAPLFQRGPLCLPIPPNGLRAWFGTSQSGFQILPKFVPLSIFARTGLAAFVDYGTTGDVADGQCDRFLLGVVKGTYGEEMIQISSVLMKGVLGPWETGQEA